MERLTRSKAIRAKCIDCCCGNTAEVRRCSITHCPLWIYRMGHEVSEICSEPTSPTGNTEFSREN